MAQRAKVLLPERAALRDTLALAHESENQLPEAIRVQQKAVGLDLSMRPHGPGASTLIEMAAIASAARARVGTRHIAADEGCAIKVLSPWDA